MRQESFQGQLELNLFLGGIRRSLKVLNGSAFFEKRWGRKPWRHIGIW